MFNIKFIIIFITNTFNYAVSYYFLIYFWGIRYQCFIQYIFFLLKLNSPSISLFVLSAAASISLFIFSIIVVFLFLFSLSRGWLVTCLMKWIFSSKAANFLSLPRGWTDTCLIKVTSLLFARFWHLAKN